MTRSKAAALLDRVALTPAAVERSMSAISLEAMGNALVQADAVSNQLVMAANIANPAPVGLIHRVLKYQNGSVALFAQRTPGSVQQIRARFDALVREIDNGLVEIQQAERSAVAEAHAADLRERDAHLAGLRTEVELLGHAATTAQQEGLADQRALRAAQQQLVQVRAAHERDLAAQAARLGEENARRKGQLDQQQEQLDFDRRALLGKEKSWNRERGQLERDKKTAQGLVGTLNAELETKDQELAALRAELETLRATPRPLEVTMLPDSPTAPLSAEQPTAADALSLRAFLVEQGMRASVTAKVVTADAPITPALLRAWAEAYPDAQTRRAHLVAAMRKGRAA